MEKIVLVLPFWWADYLMDGDYRELTKSDHEALDQLTTILRFNYGKINLKEVSNHQFYTNSHSARMFQIPACMCSHFTFETVKE